MFLSLFLGVKFILIFFFRAAYEPDVIFNLTPFHLLTGFENIQLLFLALFISAFDAYLHLNLSLKNLKISFIPTFILISGLGSSIILLEFSLDYISYYLIFIFLLISVLIDHRVLLTYDEYEFIEDKQKISEIHKKPVKTPKVIRIPKPQTRNNPNISILSSVFSLLQKQKTKKGYNLEENKEFIDQKPKNIPKISKQDHKRIQDKIDKLELKSKKLRDFEKELENRRKKIVKNEKIVRDIFDTSNDLDYYISESKKEVKNSINKRESFSFNDINDSAVITYRGKIKKINDNFKDLFGYNIDEIYEKNIMDIFLPYGYYKMEKYYLNRLKGKTVSSYEADLLTKNKEKINLNIEIKTMVIDGKKMDVFIFKKIKKENKK